MAGKGMHDNSVEQCCNVILTWPAISSALLPLMSFVFDLLGHDRCRCTLWPPSGHSTLATRDAASVFSQEAEARTGSRINQGEAPIPMHSAAPRQHRLPVAASTVRRTVSIGTKASGRIKPGAGKEGGGEGTAVAFESRILNRTRREPAKMVTQDEIGLEFRVFRKLIGRVSDNFKVRTEFLRLLMVQDGCPTASLRFSLPRIFASAATDSPVADGLPRFAPAFIKACAIVAHSSSSKMFDVAQRCNGESPRQSSRFTSAPC